MSNRPLFHVGCGNFLFTEEQLRQAKGGMALACSCGAMSPLVVKYLEDASGALAALPASLALRKDGEQPPHLEFYLGFSDFNCPAKTAVEQYLRELGSIAFAECEEERCREEPDRWKEQKRWRKS